MKKKVTHADRLRWRIIFVEGQAREILGWSLDQYATFQFETAWLFLRYYHSTDMEAMQQMWNSKAFWGWWRVNWYVREMDFLEGAAYRASCRIEGLEETAFTSVHDARRLADTRTEWGRILEDSYCRDLAASLK